MTRADARSPQTVSIKQSSNSNTSLRRFLTIIAVAVLVYIVFFICSTSDEYLGDSSDTFVVKSIPKVYTSPEGLNPEESDVFHGFRTSFLPEEEIVLARKKREEGGSLNTNFTKNGVYWCGNTFWDEESNPKRVKRMEGYSDTDYQHERDDNQGNNEDYELKSSNDDAEIDDNYEDSSNSKEYTDDVGLERLESVVLPHTHVDRGPFDDVVEQVRGQPELEEEELGSSAHLFKPSKSYSGIHAFWKGQGDRETIRKTQSHIMKQYMDEEADPCQDFYQYACGNWPTLNPIPADKAGYDTFEMLRENLDSVLKDLLEFKTHEKIPSVYPGPELNLEEDLLNNIVKKKTKSKFSLKNLLKSQSELESEQLNMTSEFVQTLYGKEHNTRDEALGRIRRYLDEIIKKKPGKPTKDKLQKKKSDELLLKQKPNKRKLKKRSINKRVKSISLHQESIKVDKDNETENESQEEPKPEVSHINDPAHGDAALKARFLFKSCMNYEILQKRGHQPLLDLLNLLGGWPILDQRWDAKKFDWLELMAKLRLFNNDILISEWVGPDIKNSDEFVIQFDQTSLGLPTREYFLQDVNRQYLEAYKTYLTKIATLLGGNKDHVKKSADKLIGFEIKLAKITSAPEDRKNVSELYRRMPLHKLEEMVPQVKWKRYLSIVMNRNVHSKETVVLFALSYVRHLVQLIHETDNSVLANYLLWRFVRHRVNNLDDRFQSAKQQFYFILFGREQAPPRWKNCIAQVNSNMGMALGSMFVKKYFDETSKNDTLTMTRDIQRSFKELLHMTDWIDDKTKDVAAHKVDAMMLRIGYPDFILTKEELDERYKEVIIHPDKYFENILNILQHLTKMEQSRIGQPVNKTLWNTAPAVVNAYYSRNKNQIMFPAGILQPPFYHRHFPRSLNYGGIGVVIGHEITHGFDDKGRLFDCDGNLQRWWSDSAIEAFHRRAQCLIDQYGRYLVPEVNMKLDGVNTQGENIADNGGVKQAFRAYLRWLRQNGGEGETLPGLNHTHTQLFFLNFAQVWCGAMRPEATRNKLKTAVHSPGRFRVIGTLSNSNDFAREFNCQPGTPMNPVHKCSVW